MEDGQLLPTSMGLSGGKLCGLHPPAEQPALELHERQLPVTLLMMPEVKVEGAWKGVEVGLEMDSNWKSFLFLGDRNWPRWWFQVFFGMFAPSIWEMIPNSTDAYVLKWLGGWPPISESDIFKSVEYLTVSSTPSWWNGHVCLRGCIELARDWESMLSFFSTFQLMVSWWIMLVIYYFRHMSSRNHIRKSQGILISCTASWLPLKFITDTVSLQKIAKKHICSWRYIFQISPFLVIPCYP